jgi:hypothetical protein
MTVTFDINAQRTCGHDAYQILEKKVNNKVEQARQAIEKHTQLFSKKSNQARNGVIDIPVVVHIVYHENAENIDEQQIASQIEALNRDFDTNPISSWPQAANTGIRFHLASTDPNENSTNGITRTYTSKTSFGINQDIKYNTSGGKTAWPSDKYLNIWVCDLAGSYLGFAQYPGGLAASDGVVIDYQYFGTSGTALFPYNEGKTTTHEVGHWLNLDHIWGIGDCNTDDLVEDTPNADGPNFGCNTAAFSCGSIDMIENFMDYTDDACMNIFTEGQKNRMLSLFAEGGFRNSFANNSFDTTTENSCKGKQVSIEILLDNYPRETSWVIKNSKNETVMQGDNYEQSLKSTLVIEEKCLSNDCYTFTIDDKYADGICCKYGEGNYKIIVNNELVADGGEFKKSESHTFCIENSDNNDESDNDEEVNEGNHCDDGLLNGDEMDVDCGGLFCDPCQQTITILSEGYFENGLDGWYDGGSDCSRYYGPYSYENNYSMRLRDDSGLSSSMVSPELNLAAFNGINVSLKLFSYSMEIGETFEIYILNQDNWESVASFSSGIDFDNDNFYEVNIPISVNLSLTQIKIECKGNSNADQVYIDEVLISGVNHLNNNEVSISKIDAPRELPAKIEMPEEDITIYPNPAIEFVSVSSFDVIKLIKLYSFDGVLVESIIVNDYNYDYDLSNVPSGAYLLVIQSEEETNSQKLIKN